MTIRSTLLVAAAGAALLFVAPPATQTATITYGFGCITNNSATDCAIGEDQLTMTVSDEGLPADVLAFRFDNAGPEDSSITGTYFDDDADVLLALFSQSDSGAGVDFAPNVGPPNLPGGNAIGFDTTGGLRFGSTPPIQPNGVNPGEWLILNLTLAANTTFDDVVAALAAETLRVGIHVQGFEGGGSESFVSTPEGDDGGFGNPVPEPGSMILLGTGIGGLLLRRLRKS
jgi:hypothetical protein